MSKKEKTHFDASTLMMCVGAGPSELGGGAGGAIYPPPDSGISVYLIPIGRRGADVSLPTPGFFDLSTDL